MSRIKTKAEIGQLLKDVIKNRKIVIPKVLDPGKLTQFAGTVTDRSFILTLGMARHLSLQEKEEMRDMIQTPPESFWDEIEAVALYQDKRFYRDETFSNVQKELKEFYALQRMNVANDNKPN